MDRYTKSELMDIARAQNIKGRSTMNKEQLWQAVEKRKSELAKTRASVMKPKYSMWNTISKETAEALVGKEVVIYSYNGRDSEMYKVKFVSVGKPNAKDPKNPTRPYISKITTNYPEITLYLCKGALSYMWHGRNTAVQYAMPEKVSHLIK